jgi:DNA-binding HxlR family transcriptional regulator
MKKLGQERLAIEYSCPVEATVDIIGGKWKSVILYHLFSGKKRFGELQRLLPGVTQRMLTLQLRELEEDGIIYRHVYREVPPKVEYSLTDFGRSLEPIMLQMFTWGEQYMQTLMEKKRRALA